MNFILYTQYYPPETGAPQVRISELANILIKAGHEVCVLTAMPNYPAGKMYPGYGGLLKIEQIDNIKIIRSWIYPTKSVRILPRLFNYFSFVLSSLIIGIFLLPKADFLISESPPLFIGISGIILTHMKKARWVFNVSDLWPDSAVQLNVIGKGLAYQISKRLELFFYRHAWLVTGQSCEILNAIKKQIPEARLYHLSNGVDTTFFVPELYSRKVREEFAHDAKCIGVYGGLHGIAQGLEQILDATFCLPDMVDELQILFIGDGPEKQSLIKRAQNNKVVKFLEPVPKADMAKILASSDMAIIPLKTHIPGAVPSKIYEAMASALPVILIASGEAAAKVTDAQSGVVVRPGDIAGLAEAIKKLTHDSQLRKRLGQNGRRTAEKEYDRKKIVHGFLEFLQQDKTAIKELKQNGVQ